MTRINTNVSSLNAQKTLARSNDLLQQSLSRLSTGLRINVGKDDPAGLIASEVLRSNIVAVERAVVNSERANQLIGTADSALGQVSSLLNDIRGLVTEAANSGALSDEQVEANQLQVDSSLESIDRIARITSFQGKRLLDGSLDFITSGVGSLPSFASGAVGTAGDSFATANVSSSTNATRATAEVGANVDVASQAVVSAGVANSELLFTSRLTTNNPNTSILFQRASGIAAGSETVTYTGNQLVFRISSAGTTANHIINALSNNLSAGGLAGSLYSATNNSGSTGAGVYAGSGTGSYLGGVASGGVNGNKFVLSAVAAGADYSDVTVQFLSGATAGSETVTYNSSAKTLTITIQNDTSTAKQIVSAINAQVGSTFSAGLASGVNGTGTLATSTTAETSGGTDSNIISNSQFEITSRTGGTLNNNVSVSFIDVSGLARGSETVTFSSGSVRFFIASGATTAGDLVTALSENADASGAAGLNFRATVASGSTGSGVIAGGTAGAARLGGATSGGVDGNRFSVTATATGSDYAGVTINFLDGATAGSETVTFNTSTKTLTISIDDGVSTAKQIVSAINAVSSGAFTATVATGSNGSGTIAASETANTSGGVAASRLRDLKIVQANFGTSSNLAVEVSIDTQASRAQLTYSGGTLTSDLTLEVGGLQGFEVFNFGTATTVDQIAAAINQSSDATGVGAEVQAGNLVLSSQEFGSKAYVSGRALTGSFDFVNSAGSASERVSGTDVIARVNGVLANSDGLKVSLNTANLDLSFNVNEDLADGDALTFNISGGGAIFQLGPNVISNQQARLGIQGVSTSTLGGVSGSLFELRSGGEKALTGDVKGAARVVDEVITAVTSLRGRLGAFQKTTLETNIITLNDTLENLTAAESSIRDADFAVETARLTRAQILVQSGSAVLSIANSRPQSVLSLLQR